MLMLMIFLFKKLPVSSSARAQSLGGNSFVPKIYLWNKKNFIIFYEKRNSKIGTGKSRFEYLPCVFRKSKISYWFPLAFNSCFTASNDSMIMVKRTFIRIQVHETAKKKNITAAVIDVSFIFPNLNISEPRDDKKKQ